MSGTISGGSFAIIPIGGGTFGAGAFPVFTPTPWTQGVAGGAITPQLLQSQQDALQAQQAASLATVSNLGGYQTGLIGNLFSQWGNNINSLGQAAASGFQTVANNSATACGGFFSCLFGF